MKKTITNKLQSMCGVFLLGAGIFTASASITPVEPMVSPASGPVLNSFPYQIFITWGESTLTLEEGSLDEDGILQLPVLVDGEEYDPWGDGAVYATGYVGYLTPDGWYDRADEDNPGTTLVIETPYIDTYSSPVSTLSITLPEGCVILNNGDLNAAKEIVYNLITVPDEQYTIPPKGSSQFSINQIVFGWQDTPLSINPDCLEKMTYGEYSYLTWDMVNPKEVSSVSINNDGTATINLGENYSKAGTMAVRIPDEYFLLNVDGGYIPNPSSLMLIYTISDYDTYPANQQTVAGNIESFFVYATQSVEFVGQLSNVSVQDVSNNNVEISSYNNTTYNGYPAVEFCFDEPQASLSIVFPAGTLSINGTPNSEPIMLDFYTAPGASVTPESGSVIEQLEMVMINWNGSYISINPACETPVTLSVGGVETDVTSNVRIGTQMIENESISMEVPALVLDFSDNPYTANGKYTINLPAGYVLLDEYNGAQSQELTLVYQIGEAVEYITAPMIVNPANGSVGEMIGQITINWSGVTLQMDNRDKDALPADYNYIDPSYVTITVEGREVTLDNTQMGGRIFTKVVQESNEQQAGGGLGDYIDMLFIDFPTNMPDAYFTWKGNVDVVLKEGAVTTTTGEINPLINLHYVFGEVDHNAVWEPEMSEEGGIPTFTEGDCEIYISWPGTQNLTIMPGARPFYQMENDDNNGDQIPAIEYMTVVDGKVKFDFSSLEAGIYILCLPEASVNLGNDIYNGEETYNFRIVDSESSEVVEIPESESLYRVISLQGITVLETTNISHVNNLPKGIYIVNGKKLIVR